MNLPSDAIGILAYRNDYPMDNRYSTARQNIFDISVIDDTTAVLVPRVESSHSFDNYLGGILTGDRTQVIWENDTRPLP